MEIFKKYRESIMYLIFGGFTVFVNILTYTILTRVFDLGFMVSNSIAWILAVLFAYITNKLFVFNSKVSEVNLLLKEFIAFINCRLFSGVIEIIFMYIMIDKLLLNDMIVKIITNIIVIILNYILSKVVIFKKQNGTQENLNNI